MENLVTNLSVWGIIIVLINTLRISWGISLPEHANQISSSARLVVEKLHFLIKIAYKPLTIFILSAFTLFVCYKITSDKFIALWSSASLAGVLSIGISMFLMPGVVSYAFALQSLENKAGKAINITFKEKNITHGGTLFISLLSLLLVCINYYNNFTWSIYAVLPLIASFAVGASSLLLCMHIYKWIIASGNAYNSTMIATSPEKILNNDRYDTLAGALVAAMLLGTTFTVNSAFKDFWLPAGAVLLPLILALSGVCISVAFSAFATIKKWQTPKAYLIEKMISAFLMIAVTYIFIKLLLPHSWVLNGVEYTSLEVFLAAQTGIIGGLLTNKVTQVYKAVHRKYFTYLVKKSFDINLLDKVFHFFINTLSTAMPVLLMVFSILLSYYLVGLYGILIALVAMLANITTKLTVGK